MTTKTDAKIARQNRRDADGAPSWTPLATSKDAWGMEDLRHLSNAEIERAWDAIASMRRAVRAEMDRRDCRAS
jgi:hypothetical protein